MLFIYTTRVTSRMMRYKYWTPVKWSRPSGKDTAVGANPRTQNETRMRKPRTESPTPLRKGKDHGKVQTIKRERMQSYRGDRSLPPAWCPQEREVGVGGRGVGDGHMSPPRFLRQTMRSSWVNRVNPPLIQTHDNMFVILINWKIAPPLWSAHTRKKIKKKTKPQTENVCFLFSFNRRLLIMSKTQSELSCESSASLQGRNGVLLMQSMILNHSAAEFMTAECQVKS